MCFHSALCLLPGAIVMTSRLPLHHVTSDDDVIGTSSSPTATTGSEASPSVLKTSGRQAPAHPLSIGYVTAAIVLGFMCLVLGLVYGYIHFTRISPRFRAARLFDHGNRVDGHNASTHIFIRNSKLWWDSSDRRWKKFWSVSTAAVAEVTFLTAPHWRPVQDDDVIVWRTTMWRRKWRRLLKFITDSVRRQHHKQQQQQQQIEFVIYSLTDAHAGVNTLQSKCSACYTETEAQRRQIFRDAYQYFVG